MLLSKEQSAIKRPLEGRGALRRGERALRPAASDGERRTVARVQLMLFCLLPLVAMIVAIVVIARDRRGRL